jgi:hypothetical protein
MTDAEYKRLTTLVALDNNDDLWAAVRLCAELERREPDPGGFFTIRAILEEIGDLTESGPVSVEPWERTRAEIVPAFRRVIDDPSSSQAIADLARCWARLKQEHPFR